jgi:hypothetical protein
VYAPSRGCEWRWPWRCWPRRPLPWTTASAGCARSCARNLRFSGCHQDQLTAAAMLCILDPTDGMVVLEPVRTLPRPVCCPPSSCPRPLLPSGFQPATCGCPHGCLCRSRSRFLLNVNESLILEVGSAHCLSFPSGWPPSAHDGRRMQMGDALVSTGLRDAGYIYVNIGTPTGLVAAGITAPHAHCRSTPPFQPLDASQRPSQTRDTSRGTVPPTEAWWWTPASSHAA